MTVKQIAVSYGVHPATVRTWIRKAGLSITQGFPWSDYTEEEVTLIGAQQKLPRKHKEKNK